MKSGAIVSSSAKLGRNVSIGAFTIIHDNVIIGDDVVIESHCVVGYETPLTDGPLRIGSNSLIRSHSVIYADSTLGCGLKTGHSVVIREKTYAGEGLQVGTFCDIQGDSTFGDHVRMQSSVAIGKKAKVGSFVWLYPFSVLLNDPIPPSEIMIGVTLGDFAIVGSGAIVQPGVTIAEGGFAASGSIVTKDVPAHQLAMGVPARVVGPTASIRIPGTVGKSAYPWPLRFHRGYPKNVVSEWLEAFAGRQDKFG